MQHLLRPGLVEQRFTRRDTMPARNVEVQAVMRGSQGMQQLKIGHCEYDYDYDLITVGQPEIKSFKPNP